MWRYLSTSCLYLDSPVYTQVIPVFIWKTRVGFVTKPAGDTGVLLCFISQNGIGDWVSIWGLLSCVFYSWTAGGASFVKTAIAAVAWVLMAAAHLWIIQTAEKETEPIYRGNCYCAVVSQSLNRHATCRLCTLMGAAACLFSEYKQKKLQICIFI